MWCHLSPKSIFNASFAIGLLYACLQQMKRWKEKSDRRERMAFQSGQIVTVLSLLLETARKTKKNVYTVPSTALISLFTAHSSARVFRPTVLDKLYKELRDLFNNNSMSVAFFHPLMTSVSGASSSYYHQMDMNFQTLCALCSQENIPMKTNILHQSHNSFIPQIWTFKIGSVSWSHTMHRWICQSCIADSNRFVHTLAPISYDIQ